MRRKSIHVQVPRDPRTDGTSFITSMPKVMAGRIDEEKWSEIMAGLNGIFHEFESPSLSSFIKIILVIPFLISRPRGMFARVEKYLDEVNGLLKDHGIYIAHPGYHQYIELEIEVYRDD